MSLVVAGSGRDAFELDGLLVSRLVTMLNEDGLVSYWKIRMDIYLVLWWSGIGRDLYEDRYPSVAPDCPCPCAVCLQRWRSSGEVDMPVRLQFPASALFLPADIGAV